MQMEGCVEKAGEDGDGVERQRTRQGSMTAELARRYVSYSSRNIEMASTSLISDTVQAQYAMFM